MTAASARPLGAGAAPRGRFAGQSVLLTGGGRGIGRACALEFAREGARLALASRTPGQLQRVSEEIRELTGSPAQCVPFDVSRADQVRAGVAEVLERGGPIDVLVNCAGLFSMGPSESAAVADSAELLATNALGTLLVSQEVGRGMLDRGRGRIVNFASLLSFTAFPGRAAYAASKGAVLQLTRVLGVEWAARGVNVNAVAPGMIRIETTHPAVAAGELSEDELLRRIPMGRRGRPEDVTGAVLFLASPQADYITGQTIVVDGGWLSYGYL
ncbi:SDR family NAD(P)-dependent oxidoreductase [Streptacidiphilus sp. P02-A3a]|uniref:SDR family NAD(P)-dependent oxidoreductase n=1 Tax=Streptacidiphilus sp. P02-A3a TaxID=2704468 RepID=UPI0015F89AA9|nr:SDR family NAD(P)-dependent oxidoreductase [Streptacidiphilus sp. P02-A3a]QMU67393.1 SDR family oxidoreductase [Streptacidiphilus sp. P02-A3a]